MQFRTYFLLGCKLKEMPEYSVYSFKIDLASSNFLEHKNASNLCEYSKIVSHIRYVSRGYWIST